MPSSGIDRRTGKVLRDLDHVRQSVGVILSTRFGSRVVRRTFGSDVPGLIGRSDLTAPELLRFKTAIILAIETWEPRLRVVRVVYPPAQNTPELMRIGKMGLAILCRYRPNALQGDTTSDTSVVYL